MWGNFATLIRTVPPWSSNTAISDKNGLMAVIVPRVPLFTPYPWRPLELRVKSTRSNKWAFDSYTRSFLLVGDAYGSA